MRAGRATIERLARERLGFERLRPGQLRAVQALAAGRDALAVLPTGGGKSAIYELAGLLREGPTVVVSPLIALQDDQLAHLNAAGLRAVVLNSQQPAGARAAALIASCDSGTFVFLSPEQAKRIGGGAQVPQIHTACLRCPVPSAVLVFILASRLPLWASDPLISAVSAGLRRQPASSSS